MNKSLILAAAGVSFLLLSGAYVFEFFGYPPCRMCYWQRWPHMAAIAIGLLAMFFPVRVLGYFGAAAALTTASVGFFHAGVEKKWWEGPSSCTGGGAGLDGMSGSDLLSFDVPKLIMCDQVSWEFLTISMAGWNGILSIGAMVLWIFAVRSSR
jgi:disulfide bond formation protein DsbB